MARVTGATLPRTKGCIVVPARPRVAIAMAVAGGVEKVFILVSIGGPDLPVLGVTMASETAERGGRQ